MNKTIRELEVGKEYIFIEANPHKSKDLNIVRAILKSYNKSERGWLPEFETNDELKGEFFFIHELNKTNKPLNEIMVIWVNSNYDKPEAREKLFELFGTIREPIGYIMCDADSVEETINQYSNFLIDSINKYQDKIEEMIKDLDAKREIYKQQMNWLEKTFK